LPDDLQSDTRGYYASPSIHAIRDLSELGEEVFGPVLHVLRWESDALVPLCHQLAGLGYGLTLGIQSRIQHTIDTIQVHFPVGNTYVNRNMIGAVVGVQPFGGHGLSGTGPKAGGPHYLLRFALECTVSVDTTASGGNTELWGAHNAKKI
jgi:RHH-type proline utilization regulon transcriptional repressor/proline dehydrogenase/delta 1-pyrroline-5-carboxylate dehydrogenase